MTTKQTLAVGAYNSGFNCAQAVLSAFCDDYGLDKDTAMQLSSAMGGGFRVGEICGAAAGAGVVIGLKYGQHRSGDAEAKQLCYDKTIEYMNAFKAVNGALACRNLLERDISDKKEYEELKLSGVFKSKCSVIISNAVRLLEELDY